MKYKTPVSLVLAASALLMLGAVLPSVAADGQSTQVKKGHAVMEKLAKQSVASVDKKIAAQEQKERLQKLSSQPLSLRFQNALIMGDSLAEAFGDYQLVSSSNLLATRGRRTDNIDQEIATAISLAPRTIFLSYGMNDLEYCRGNAQRFIRQYKKQIHKLKEALPDTKIFINSLIPMDAAAIAQIPVYARYKEFNEALKQMCEEEQITYIDNTALMDWSPAVYEIDGSGWHIWQMRPEYETQYDIRTLHAAGCFRICTALCQRQQGNQSGYIEEAACPLCDRYGEEGCRMGTQAVPSG